MTSVWDPCTQAWGATDTLYPLNDTSGGPIAHVTSFIGLYDSKKHYYMTIMFDLRE